MSLDQAQLGRGATDGASGNTQEVAAQAKEQVQQKAEEVKAKASDRVRDQLDQQSTALGRQVTSVSQAFDKAAEHLEREGNTAGAKVAHQAGRHVQRLGGYLESSNADRLLGDLESFGRRQPWAAGAAGMVAGFVGARFLKASSETRYDASSRSQHDADLPTRREAEETAAVPPLHPGAGTEYGSR